MKLKLQLKICVLTFCSLISYTNSNSQCSNQVTHLAGTAVVNGVDITVTTTGHVDDNTSYCVNTFPYFVGYNSTTGSANGMYTFDFFPPVNSLTLNFSGISNAGIGQESVVLAINGIHYAIPSVGDPNGCDALADLTVDGDITGCVSCSVSGWLGTTITGNISSLQVADIAVWGQGNGAIFSLFICDAVNGTPEYENIFANDVYPNPFTTSLNLKSNNSSDVEFTLYDAFSNKLIHKTIPTISSLNTEFLSSGIYFYELKQEGAILKKGKLIKE